MVEDIVDDNLVVFYMQGSAPEPYKITFTRLAEKTVAAYCTCPAGKNGMYCKHRMQIILGDTKKTPDLDQDKIRTVRSWLPDSNIHQALLNILRLEKKVAKANVYLQAARKELGKAMRGVSYEG